MAKGTQLWQADMEHALQRARNKIAKAMQESQDVPAWKKLVSFAAPFVISAALPGLGTALTGAAAGKGALAGSKLASYLGKGLSMGKATGAKSMLQGLISKGGAHMIGGAGIRKLMDIIDPPKKISLEGLTDLEKLYAGKAQQEAQQDMNKYRKDTKKAYLLADLMAAGSSLIPENPLDMFGQEPGTPVTESSKVSINPATNKKYDTMWDVYKKNRYNQGIQGKSKSISQSLAPNTTNKFVADSFVPEFSDTSSIPQYGDKSKSIIKGLTKYQNAPANITSYVKEFFKDLYSGATFQGGTHGRV